MTAQLIAGREAVNPDEFSYGMWTPPSEVVDFFELTKKLKNSEKNMVLGSGRRNQMERISQVREFSISGTEANGYEASTLGKSWCTTFARDVLALGSVHHEMAGTMLGSSKNRLIRYSSSDNGSQANSISFLRCPLYILSPSWR